VYASLDFGTEVFDAMVEVADWAGGTLCLTRDGRVVVVGVNDAETKAAAINESGVLFPFGSVRVESIRFGLPPYDMFSFEV